MTLIFNIIEDFGTLEPFLKYYASKGVTQFICGLHGATTIENSAQISSKLARYPHRIHISYSEEFNGERDADSQDMMRKHFVAADEWYIVADPDEFHYHPRFSSFTQMREAAEQENASYVSSRIVDRLSASGEFLDVHPELPLDDQFPLTARLTETVLCGCCSKVVMARAPVAIRPGHHFATGTPASFECRTHHFKWQGKNLRQVVETRLASYKRQSLYYWQEPNRFLEYLQGRGGRIDITDSALQICASERIGT